MRLLFVGPPGAGKGTQAKKYAQEKKLPHIATGDILREAIRQGTAVGMQAKSYIEAGKLVPDGVIIDLIGERFGQDDVARGYILDGFPRTLPQAKALEDLLARRNQPLQGVVLLECPDSAIVERITGRRTCEKCGTPYHVKYQKPKREGVCDQDGGPLTQRVDDTEEKIVRRLGQYHAETAAIIPFYEKKGIVRRVDATLPPGDVYRAVEKALAAL